MDFISVSVEIFDDDSRPAFLDTLRDNLETEGWQRITEDNWERPGNNRKWSLHAFRENEDEAKLRP